MYSSYNGGAAPPMASPARQNGFTGGRSRGGGRGGREAPDLGAPQQNVTRTYENGNGVKTAADLDRDARNGFEAMRDLLKSQPPWSRDIENQRQKIRNYQQTLIFNHPVHPLAQSLDPIWIRTSYTLIASFREHVSRAESAPASNVGNGRRGPRDTAANQDLKKVLTRFRQALASEEGFYRVLISRLVRHFGLEQICGPVLAGVGLSPGGGSGSGIPGKTDDAGMSELSLEERRDKAGLVYKALICLGDIERYKEQYSDEYMRDRSGMDRRGKGDGADGRFGKARTYYDTARALVPEDGSAYNQLAVISTYLNDDFSTIYNYFRALAIKVPFKSVSEILDKYLKKAFERQPEREATWGGEPVVEDWKREVGVLVAVLYRQNGFSNLPSLKASILPGLSNLLLARHLPSETIVRLSVISIGLHWHTRSLASLTPMTTSTSSRAQQAEESSLDFMLCVFIVLLTISASEVEEVMRVPGWTNPTESAIEEDDERGSGLSSSISAVLRRILPSLRLLSKWVKLHFDYMSRFPTNDSNPLSTSIPTFWSAYYRLIEALARAFPLGMLPSLEMGLEEDEDMRGFLPISRGLLRSKSSKVGQGTAEQVHPNEEQLMRIADLQVDATLILQAQTSGSSFIPESQYDISTAQGEDDHASVSTETEDDPVSMAMRASLGEGNTSEYEEDEVAEYGSMARVGHVGYTPQTTHSTPSATRPQPTAQDLLQNLFLDQQTPSPTYPNPNYAKRDSLNRGVPSPRTAPLRQSGSGSGSPGLLFGGEGIWSVTREESNSQKGLKRDVASAGENALSRPTSERPQARKIGGEGVKALWDNQIMSPGQGQGSNFGMHQGTQPVDAAQLFAGISGMGQMGQQNGSHTGRNGQIGASPAGAVEGGRQYGSGSGFGQIQGNGQSMWSGMPTAPHGQGGTWGNPAWS